MQLLFVFITFPLTTQGLCTLNSDLEAAALQKLRAGMQQRMGRVEGVGAEAEIGALTASLIGQRNRGKRVGIDDDTATAAADFLIHHIRQHLVVPVIVLCRYGSALLR